MSKIQLVGLSLSFNTGEKAYDFNRTFKNILFFLDGILRYVSKWKCDFSGFSVYLVSVIMVNHQINIGFYFVVVQKSRTVR